MVEAVILRKVAQLDKELRLDSTFAGSVPSASGEGGRGKGWGCECLARIRDSTLKQGS